MRQVGLLLFPGFAEFEVMVAASLLRDSHDLVTLALTEEAVTSEAGLIFSPHKPLEDVDPAELDALIIPGGDMVHLKDTEPLFSFVGDLYKRGALLAAICSGPYVLARAGVFARRPYTVTFTKEQRDFLGCFGEAGFRYRPVLADGNVITAQGHAFAAFGLAVARHLCGDLSEDTTAFYEGRADAFMEPGVEATGVAQADSA